MMEYKINDLITLKLEDSKTIIYVLGELFNQCRFLMLVIPDEDAFKLEKVNSIDEAAETLNRGLDPDSDTVGYYSAQIDPITEFWAHCSNMEVWAENNYDSRLLHSNLSFPLLKKLTELGDPTAKKRFKEEIGIRYFSGVKSVRMYLEEEGYLEYLSRDEIKSFVNSGVDILDELEGILGKELRISTLKSIFSPVVVRNGEIVQLRLGKLRLRKIPDCVQNLRFLELLDISSNGLEELPGWIGKLKSLKRLEIYGNKITTIPETIGELKSLKILKLSDNNLSELPESIGNLKSLEELYLSRNRLKYLPESIGWIKNLERLTIQKNQLERIPRSIGNLKALRILDLSSNPISELPDSISNLKSLKDLEIRETNVNINNGLFKKLKEKKVFVYY